MNSLFALGDLRKGLNHVLTLAPGHQRARLMLARIDHAVPDGAYAGLAMLKRLLDDAPHFTPAMAALATAYRDQGWPDEAREWAKKCVAETASSAPNDFRKFDKPACASLLRELGN
jgi:hypothetical protein